VRNTFYAGLIAKLKNIPLIWHIRTCDKDKYDKILYHLSTKVIVVAESLRSRFPWDDNSKRKLITIYNGVDLDGFKPQNKSYLLRNKYGIKSNCILISVVARIDPMKGQIFLIKAVQKIKKSLSNFVILLAGEIGDEKYLKKCKKLIKEYNLQNKILMLGHISNVNMLLVETDVVVLPSISSEGFPRSIIEAMAVSKPVITTNIGGSPEAVENNISGLIVPSKDTNALADKMLLLMRDSNLRNKIGSEARKRAVKYFGIHKNVKKIENLYQKILSGN
jgi:glycosyltransferase involved in cell wall biosynthesis